MGIINENFILRNETAKHLYNDYAKTITAISTLKKLPRTANLKI